MRWSRCLRCESGWGGGLCAEEEDEQDQRQDGDDVVEYGRPHVGAECVFGVEDLSDDSVEAVEEDLG